MFRNVCSSVCNHVTFTNVILMVLTDAKEVHVIGVEIFEGRCTIRHQSCLPIVPIHSSTKTDFIDWKWSFKHEKPSLELPSGRLQQGGGSGESSSC